MVILSLLLLVLDDLPGAEPYFVGHNCPVNGYSYSTGSTFEDNLNSTLITHLGANASRMSFSNFNMGEGIDQVYALYYCRADVGLEACHDCVESATTRIQDVCKLMKQGIVWYDECTLRYANHTIFSLDDQDLRLSFPRFNNTLVLGDYLNQYRTTFDSSMRNLIDRVANNASLRPRGFSTERVTLSPFQSLRGIAQCAPVITGASCQRCLTAALRQMDLWTTTMEFLPTCFVGFELYGLPPSTPPPSSSTLPLPGKCKQPLYTYISINSK